MKPKNTFQLSLNMGTAPEGTVYVRSPEDCYGVVRETGAYEKETFMVLCLNTRNRLIAGGMISVGTMDTTLVHPRDVFKAAITAGACVILLAHNHPSGDPAPSADDVRITRQMIQAGQIVGIKVMDHVIIGRPSEEKPRGYLSMREAGLVEFES